MNAHVQGPAEESDSRVFGSDEFQIKTRRFSIEFVEVISQQDIVVVVVVVVVVFFIFRINDPLKMFNSIRRRRQKI